VLLNGPPQQHDQRRGRPLHLLELPGDLEPDRGRILLLDQQIPELLQESPELVPRTGQMAEIRDIRPEGREHDLAFFHDIRLCV
jgi:hypothetical protein